MSSIKGNVKSFIFDESRTITFWSKDTQESSVNEIACIVGSINASLEVTNYSSELTALSSDNFSDFLLANGKQFVFEKISANSFIIATYVEDQLSYRIGTLNDLSITFEDQVEINTVLGKTIKIAIIGGKAILFYIADRVFNEGTEYQDTLSTLCSYNTLTNLETVWKTGEFNNSDPENITTEQSIFIAQHKIDTAVLNNKLILIGYKNRADWEVQKYYPSILIANYVNDEFIIESITAMEDVRVSGFPFGNAELTTGVFFTENNKFFLAFADNQSNAIPA